MSVWRLNCFSRLYHSFFTGKRIKTNPISLDFPRDFRLVFIISYGHTFCTNLANAGMNPKALQYIMGHSNITMTLNYYAHATFVSAKAEMERLIAA